MSGDNSNPISPTGRSSFNQERTRVAAGDDALMDGVRSKDQAAMAEIFDRYAGLVYSISLRVLNDQGYAEDVMQQIFFEVWERPQSFVPGRGSLAGWLSVVARNRAIDHLRRGKPSDSIDEVVLPAQSNLSVEAERRLMMEKVRTRLELLPKDQQESLELAFFEGLSHSEIAAQTGIPLGTIKTRIRSALHLLREAVQA
ncbi:sigma-70 family RNA polymerase sigma factor [Terracidiphilus gabretensis]|jgi:RNA polymerase sigma-70 factor, ECF subfamily|uniref:sigma-70 family RNA polymerase sigma factor n=1 Tax=Terracidiphilus gabretensis TaxID=1577687 RepID=UPI0009EAD8DB|nr:sigma-70 family RNA polymerase sigma factor [Terracidiphilus gabretensis]